MEVNTDNKVYKPYKLEFRLVGNAIVSMIIRFANKTAIKVSW